jgi:class 3 adenylate cyclase/tetratricopeptide (TPR) repeat protein
MQCPACAHHNPEGVRFCGNCGAPVGELACPHCGAQASPGQSFCHECGQRLSAAAPAAETDAAAVAPPPVAAPPLPQHLADKVRRAAPALKGERKRVTVLFADVKGSMELANSLDPERWRAIMERFFSILSAGVHRFEGTVDKFTGDGMMALFGAPIAHEDHAARACYAALHLRDELAPYATELRREQGLSFSVRMGINSGEVVLGAIGDDLSLDYTAIGHTVGLAQRMESLAEPGKVYVTEHTAALVEGYFTLGDLGEFAIKGAGEPVRVYEVQSVGPLRTRLQVAERRGLSRFVGRTEEMAELERAWERAAEGDAQIIGVVAEPGVGKSRLCFEFTQRCRARGVIVNAAHALAHAHAVPFLPVLEILRDYFGIADTDDDRTAREKVAGRLLLLDERFKDTLPLLFEFLGVPDPDRPVPQMDPEARQRQLFGALDRLLRARSAQEPAVILLEDMHWLDPGSEAFLGNFVGSLPGTRTLVLATFRPEYRADWMQRTYYRRAPLRPLGDEAVDELVTELLGSDPSLDGLAELIRDRTGGNPFFVEEVVQGLVESGGLEGDRSAYRLVREIGEIAIPPTVESLLAARIDRLAERDKAVLQTASVIGREFSEPVLARVSGLAAAEVEAALRALVTGEFVYQQALYPVAEYAFKHALTEEVAYRSQLGERRAGTHAATARAIEELEPDVLDERAALLSHHWAAAGDALQAARWSARAAAWAGFTDPREALRHWSKVRELIAETEEDQEAATLGLTARVMLLSFSWRFGLGADLRVEADRLLAEGEALADRTGQLGLKAVLLAGYAGLSGVLAGGDAEDHLRIARRALELAEEAGDRGVELAVLGIVAYPLYLLGRLRESLAITERGLERAGADRSLGAGLGFASPYGWAEFWRAAMLANMGRLAEGRAELERVLQVSRDAGDLENQLWAHHWLIEIADHGAGDGEVALVHARTAYELAERVGGSFAQAWAQYFLGTAHALRREWPESIAAIERALELARERRTALEGEPRWLAGLARARLGLGDSSGALSAAEEALGLALQRRALLVEIEARVELARARLASDGDGAEAEIRAELERALALAREIGARMLEPRVRTALAELALAIDDEAGAQREQAEARRLLTEMGVSEPVRSALRD